MPVMNRAKEICHSAFDANLRICEALINKLRYLSWKQRRRQAQLPVWRDWLEVIVSVVVSVLLINQFLVQLFIIPSGSMIPTLQINDRVVVNKLAYGLELVPFGKKYFSQKHVERGELLPFVSPEYRQRGTLFTIAQRAVYLLSLTRVDLDILAAEKRPLPPVRLASQPPFYAPNTLRYTGGSSSGFQPSLLVKRAIALGGDTVRFTGGDVEIKLAGQSHFISEAELKQRSQLKYQTQRNSAAYQASDFGRAPQRYRQSYLANPHDSFLRSRFLAERMGDAVPLNYVEPFGDNRDNSHDGRWFGTLSRNDLQGRVSFIFFPFKNIRKFPAGMWNQ